MFFSGNRAEFGLQRPVIEEAVRCPDLDVSVLVSGAHLDPYFGKTIEEISDSNIRISGQIEIAQVSRDRKYTPLSIAKVIEGVSNFLAQELPDIFVVYADRFEGFGALIASTQMNIPSAHIEGGDLTEGGALDDSIRHAMTKLAHLHFTTNENSMQRVLGLGEERWRVKNVGFPAIDLIIDKKYATREEIVTELGVDINKPLVLFTQHSVTIEPELSRVQMRESIKALRKILELGIQVVLTYPNNDDGSHEIIEEIEKFEREAHELLRVRKSLGRHLYHGVLALALDSNSRVVCAGNSSSGIKETPAFGCPTVNIGSRQANRLRGENVIDADYNEFDIFLKLKGGLFDENIREICKNTSNPYYQGGASKRIIDTLRNVRLGREMLQKRMTL